MRFLIAAICLFLALPALAGLKADKAESRQVAQTKEFVPPARMVTWTFIDGEDVVYVDKDLQTILSAANRDFADPFCVRNTLLRHENTQTNVAMGRAVVAVRSRSYVESKQGKGVEFTLKFAAESDVVPAVTFCAMKTQ